METVLNGPKNEQTAELHGRLDAHAVADLKAVLASCSMADLSRVAFLDATAINVLVDRKASDGLLLKQPSLAARIILEIA